jgi:FkbM family methyltransferase
MNKIALITDSFVHNKSVESKLIKFLELFQESFEICLVTNTPVSTEIMDKVNHLIYDSRNQLFTDDFDQIPDLIVFREFDNFRIETSVSGNQPHGLSVLVNLFNQISHCKNLGYTHILRLEIDTQFQPESVELIKSHIHNCINSEKSGYFYVGEQSIICQYFFTQIDSFLNSVYHISNQKDYQNFLSNKFGNNNFINVEKFLYYNLIDKQEFIFKSESQLHNEFNNIVWNDEVSSSHLDSKYQGCTTMIVKFSDQDRYLIYSENFVNVPKNRKIKVFTLSGEYEIYHNLADRGYWSYNEVGSDIQRIEVFEGEDFIYQQTRSEINSKYIDKTTKKVYFDIGCNIGEYTESLRRSHYDKIVCVDANPNVIQKVNERFSDDDKIVVLNRAVSSQKEDVDFYICNSCDVISTCDERLINDSRFTGRHNWDTIIKVPTISIDDMVNQFGKPEHIKIDVEGYEFSVIQSMTMNYGSEIRFEWSEERIDDILQIVRYLSSLGYKGFSCLFEDKYDAVASDYKPIDDFIEYMIQTCDYNRRQLWGMIYCK